MCDESLKPIGSEIVVEIEHAPNDALITVAAYGLLESIDLVEVDRDAIREAIAAVGQFSHHMIGEELTLIGDRQAIEDSLARMYDID